MFFTFAFPRSLESQLLLKGSHGVSVPGATQAPFVPRWKRAAPRPKLLLPSTLFVVLFLLPVSVTHCLWPGLAQSFLLEGTHTRLLVQTSQLLAACGVAAFCGLFYAPTSSSFEFLGLPSFAGPSVN